MIIFVILLYTIFREKSSHHYLVAENINHTMKKSLWIMIIKWIEYIIYIEIIIFNYLKKNTIDVYIGNAVTQPRHGQNEPVFVF